MPTTTNYNVNMPTVGADSDTWGTENNNTHQAWDSEIFRVEGLVATKLSLTGGTLTGNLQGTTATFSGVIAATGGFTGNVTGNVSGSLSGNAATATALQTARNFSLSGVVTSSVISFNGTGDVAFSTAIADGALSVAKTSGLQAALDAKEPLLNANQKRAITYGTASPSGTPSDGDIYLKHEA